MLALRREVGRIAREVAGDIGHAAAEALQGLLPAGRGRVDHAAKRADLQTERIDFLPAELDAFEDFLGEARKVRNGRTGDLGRRREGAQIAQRLLHVGDMGAERFFRHRHTGKALLTGFLYRRKRRQLVDGRRKPADRRLRGFVIERTGQIFQRCNQAVEHVENREQHHAAVEKALLDAGTGPFEAGNEFRLGRLPLHADCARCS